jgi:hypothetical protein
VLGGGGEYPSFSSSFMADHTRTGWIANMGTVGGHYALEVCDWDGLAHCI